MNRLKYHHVYCAGPISYAPDAGCAWRDMVSPWLTDMGIIVLNPCKKPLDTDQLGFRDENMEDTLRLKEMMESDPDRASAILKDIRHFDLRLVDRADFLIVYLPEGVRTCGSWEEVFTANRAKKPVLVMSPQGISTAPMWVRGTLPKEFFFDNWADLFSYLKRIDSGEECCTLNRWVFFALNEQIERIFWQSRSKESQLRAAFAPLEYNG